MTIRFPNWMRLSLEPDELIGEHKMLRWWILPPNPWVNVYVHNHVGDDPRFMHDHPCDNISIRLAGELVEFVPIGLPAWDRIHRRATNGTVTVYFDDDDHQAELGDWMPRFVFRRAEHAHRLELFEGMPAWTIWIRFRNRRKWGFFEPNGWRLARSHRQPGS